MKEGDVVIGGGGGGVLGGGGMGGWDAGEVTTAINLIVLYLPFA